MIVWSIYFYISEQVSVCRKRNWPEECLHSDFGHDPCCEWRPVLSGSAWHGDLSHGEGEHFQPRQQTATG